MDQLDALIDGLLPLMRQPAERRELRLSSELYLAPQKPIAVIAHDGPGDAKTVMHFAEHAEVIERAAQRIVVDLSRCKYLNSAQPSHMLNLGDSLAADGGGLVLGAVPPKVMVILDMLDLTRHLQLEARRADALERVGLQPWGASPAVAALLARAREQPRASAPLQVAADCAAERGDGIAAPLSAMLRHRRLRHRETRCEGSWIRARAGEGPARSYAAGDWHHRALAPDEPPRVQVILPTGCTEVVFDLHP